MSEYANDAYMMLGRGATSSIYAVTFGARAVLQLIQFFRRLEKEMILNGGEVEDFEKFVKATDGKYEIYNVPLSADSVREDQLSDIRERLDAMRIRYTILPDVSGKENYFQIAVYKEDLKSFQQFEGTYIHEKLMGGELSEADIRNFTGGDVTMVSIPEEALSDMKSSMNQLKINYAMLPDLNLTDGEKQLIIENRSLSSMKELYRLYRQNLMKQGQDVADMHEMSESEYQNTGKMTEEEYMGSARDSVKEAAEKYDTQDETLKEKIIFSPENTVRSSKSPECKEYVENPSFLKLTIDEATLVKNPKDPLPEQMEQMHPENFYLRIPGTWGEGEHILSVPKSQVFMVDDANRTRYLCFINKDEKPKVYTADGGSTYQYPTGQDLFDRFDKPKDNMPRKMIRKKGGFEERGYSTDELAAIERMLLSRSAAPLESPLRDVPKPPMVK